ncbi:MAG: hypothetical protein ACK52I_20850 [Pseudomonadota bacterium]
MPRGVPDRASGRRSAVPPDRTRAAHPRRRPHRLRPRRPSLTSSGRNASTGSQRPSPDACAPRLHRPAEQVARLSGTVEGVVVGSALVEVLERGEDPTAWLKALRQG